MNNIIRQEYLRSIFKQGMWWIVRETPAKETFSKTTLRTIAVRILERNGKITGRDMVPFTNGPSDLFHELRKQGYIKPMAFDRWEVGKSGKRYKVYQWSGKTMEKKEQ